MTRTDGPTFDADVFRARTIVARGVTYTAERTEWEPHTFRKGTQPACIVSLRRSDGVIVWSRIYKYDNGNGKRHVAKAMASYPKRWTDYFAKHGRCFSKKPIGGDNGNPRDRR